MKFSEMNAKQKKATLNIKYASQDYIYGLLNGCFDNAKDSQEYKDYYNELSNTDNLINEIYSNATTNIYREGHCSFGAGAQKEIKDIRFCGKDFLMMIVKHYVKKYQSDALSELE